MNNFYLHILSRGLILMIVISVSGQSYDSAIVIPFIHKTEISTVTIVTYVVKAV